MQVMANKRFTQSWNGKYFEDTPIKEIDTRRGIILLTFFDKTAQRINRIVIKANPFSNEYLFKFVSPSIFSANTNLNAIGVPAKYANNSILPNNTANIA
jgi:hypothetical protein